MIKKIYAFYLLFYKQKKEVLKNFLQISNYFTDGEYRYDDTLQFIYKNDQYNNNLVHGLLKNNKSKLRENFKIRFFKKLFFSKKINISNSSDNKQLSISGTIFLVSNNGENEGKIFDFENNKIATCFVSLENLETKLKYYDKFKDYFQIPKIISTDKKNKIVIEELINFESEENWSIEDYKRLMDYIQKIYASYVLNIYNVGKYKFKNTLEIVKAVECINPNINLKGILDISNENLHKEYPYLDMHGDLWAGNILYVNDNTGNSYYFIDWELSNEFIFFYDIFWLMKDEAISNSNFYYIETYLAGGYDEFFEKYFRIFDLVFIHSDRFWYLTLFYLNAILKRGVNRNAINILVGEYHDLKKQLDNREKNGT